MPIRRGSQFPYREFRERYAAQQSSPVIWQWQKMTEELGAARHAERGTLALTLPDGSAEIVRDTAVAFQVVRAGEQTQAHAHSWWHLFVVRSGTGSIAFEDQVSDLNPGDIVLVPAWVTHRFDNPGLQGDLVLLNLMNIPQLADLGNIGSREKELADEPV